MDHVRAHGWVRVPAAFSAGEATRMRDSVWTSLAATGILRDDPATWRKERPDHLQHLKSDPVFHAVGSERTLAAIDLVLVGQRWRKPSDWGAFFILFPAGRPWDVPAGGWHLDADDLGPLWPPKGVKVHSMFGDVAPRAGGMNIISGSHQLVYQWFQEHPPRPAARTAELRASLHRHPYLRDLCTPGDVTARRRVSATASSKSVARRCKCWRIRQPPAMSS